MTKPEPIGCPMNRRRFLNGLGAGAAASAFTLGSGGVGGAVAAGPDDSAELAAAPDSTAFFGRMFPTLPPFATPSKALTEALTDLGRPRGGLDAKDDLSQGPVALITDPALSINNPDNPTHTAGTTFFGQFVDHDLTFDVTSALNVPTEARTTRNERNPTLNLDSVYGAGPFISSHLYGPGDKAKLKIESGGLFEDLPRAFDMTAIIADPRNDENMMISGLHAAFILFHNRAVDFVRAENPAPAHRQYDFTRARQLTTWHYQWMVVHEFLPQIVGQAMVDDILRRGRHFYTPTDGKPVMPVEFQGAAYRFGHSMVRPSYRANSRVTGVGRSSASSLTQRLRTRVILTTWSEDSVHPGALSDGKRSLTSTTTKSSATRRSTRASRRPCSTSPSAPSRPASLPRRCHSATSCVA